VSADRPDLGKGLLGYRRSAVDQVISDRDTMLRHAEARVRAAEGNVADLLTELSSLREANVRISEQMDQLRAELQSRDAEPLPVQVWASERPAPPPEPPPRDEVTSKFMTEELAGILAAAEQSASRIVERARTSTEQQIVESNRLWRDVQGEVSRFGVWRDQVEPAIRRAQSKVEGVRDLVDDVPERIRQALAPMADAIAAIEADMAELTSALTPPLLLTPGGEGEEDERDA
jgi:cell division septum initiation protein DivIVA